MGVDHYDCYVCGDTGIYEEYIAHCDSCGAHICSECLDCKEDNTSYINYKSKKLYQKDDDDDECACEGTIKEGFCKSCEDIKKNKYIMFIGS